MSPDDRGYRRAAQAATTDLEADDRQLVLEVVDEWLADHPVGPRPDPVDLVHDVRAGLDLSGPSSGERAAAPVRPRRRVAARVAAAVAVVAAALGLRWWLEYEAVPALAESGWNSDEVESVRVEGLLDSTTVFRCAPGTIEARLGFVAPQGRSAELEAVTVPVLDEWLATRGATEVMRDPEGLGDIDDLVPFTGADLGRSSAFARLRLTWEIAECPVMDGFTIVSDIEVTYRALGRTRHARVELLEPVAFTTLPLDDLSP